MSNANVFLILNLGCEMLFVIDQRLKAQSVSLIKSAQILRDLTAVLLAPNFIQQLMSRDLNLAIDSPLVAPQQCRILFTDIACCSLMHLDTNSMDKLWDLMIMIFKWQIKMIEIIKSTNILNVTCRHLDGVGKLMPELKKTILIDLTKTNLLNFWNNNLNTLERNDIQMRLIEWLAPFNTKISLLLRLGLQKPDGDFMTEIINSEHFLYYSFNLGDNIYLKNINLSKSSSNSFKDMTNCSTNEIQTFVNQINFKSDKNITNLLILDDITFSTVEENSSENNNKKDHEFIFIKSNDNTTPIDKLFDKLSIETVDGEIRSDTEINVTEQLLEMLDEKSV